MVHHVNNRTYGDPDRPNNEIRKPNFRLNDPNEESMPPSRRAPSSEPASHAAMRHVAPNVRAPEHRAPQHAPKKTRSPKMAPPAHDPKKNARKRRKKGAPTHRHRALSWGLLAVAAICLILGLYFIIRPAIMHRNQGRYARLLLEQMRKKEGQSEQDDPSNTDDYVTITVHHDDIYMEGIYDDDYDVIYPPGYSMPPDGMPKMTQPPGQNPQGDRIVTIRTDALLRIPTIGLECAVAPDVKSSTLLVVPGHYPSSPQLGEVGVVAYFGHHTRGRRDSNFSNLNKIKPGEKVIFERKGQVYTYVVETTDIIRPKRLGEFVFEKTSDKRLLLVTCQGDTPSSSSTKYRFVVRGILESVKPAR
jgi:LPXTG-site transpeptidase (sortase) family protein